nr:hypothetical protein [Tanacetum cinerariifolium]
MNRKVQNSGIVLQGDVPLEVVDESKISDNSSKKSTQNMHLVDEGFIDDDDDGDDDNNDDKNEDDDNRKTLLGRQLIAEVSNQFLNLGVASKFFRDMSGISSPYEDSFKYAFSSAQYGYGSIDIGLDVQYADAAGYLVKYRYGSGCGSVRENGIHESYPKVLQKRQAYMQLKDEEIQEEVQTESGDHEDYSKDDHEVNSLQTETDIGSTSHGTSVIRKETRALNDAKKK